MVIDRNAFGRDFDAVFIGFELTAVVLGFFRAIARSSADIDVFVLPAVFIDEDAVDNLFCRAFDTFRSKHRAGRIIFKRKTSVRGFNGTDDNV